MVLSQHDMIRVAAEENLSKFIKLVAPHRHHGPIHEEVIRWWNREDAKSHQLLLLPRDHLKSSLLAYRCAWRITKDPAVTILYISNTSNLAEKQLKFVKDILTSPIYRRYWPEMVHPDEGKREKWSSTEIAVDHPLRKAEGVRDPTMFTAGLTTSITGLHCKVAALDDVVVYENAYTLEGREKVEQQYSLLSSIEQADAEEWVVGTRYDGRDLYGKMIEMTADQYDEEGNIVSQEPIYEVFQREVEDRGDGTGEFIWPRTQRADGKWFGFNQQILAKKRGQYLDQSQFRAQYYHSTSDPTQESIQSDRFQYFEQQHIVKERGKWTFRGKPLNVFAAIDFAFSLSAKADSSALVVIGIDADHNIYVLDIDRFKTNKISEYYDRIIKMYHKWDMRKIRAEVTVAQDAIVEELKLRLRTEGILLSVDSFRPNRTMGTKEERIDATLRPRYENQTIYHYKSGATNLLEEELVMLKPRHDDIKDALANAIAIAMPPVKRNSEENKPRLVYSSRFGGVSG